MTEVRSAIIPWQECEYVTPRNAARILGLRPGALNDRIGSEELDAMTLPGGRQIVITVESVLRLIKRAEHAQLTARKEAKRQSKARPLRLVVSNQ